MPPETHSEALLELAQRGPVRARDLDRANIPRSYLQRLCDRGLLERVDRGLYRLVDAPVTELSSLADVAVRVPHSTVCLLSALQVHGLTTEVPYAVWIMLALNARMPTIANPVVEVVRASGRSLTTGVETRNIEGVDVRITTPPKTVADCFRYRSRVGLDVALEAMRDYLRRGESIDSLVQAARDDRVFSVMRPYLEALT